MQQKEYSQKFLKQRRFLTVLPLLILPFMTFMFWALGGGKTTHADAQNAQKGFNMQLPGAHLKDDKPLDKLSYYDKAAADSLKLQQQIKSDPYYHAKSVTDSSATASDSLAKIAMHEAAADTINKMRPGNIDANEAKVYRKLAQLNAAINKPPTKSPVSQDIATSVPGSPDSKDIDRLEQMMNSMNEKGGDDPEMQQLNGMLGKILDIQHPDLVRERIRQSSEAKRGMVLPVSANIPSDPFTLLTGSGQQHVATDSNRLVPVRKHGFYSIGEEDGHSTQNAIEAVIHETQTLVNGSTVKMRLTDDVYISGVLIPRNSFVFGAAQLNGERLTIKISSIRYKNSLFPVELSVYDMDGMAGIYIPGAITRDVAKESADRSIQEFGFTTVNPSAGAQAASAGIQAAKTLFSRKIKLIKVTVKAGYEVLLHDEKQKQNN